MIRSHIGTQSYWDECVEYEKGAIQQFKENLNRPGGDERYAPQFAFQIAQKHWHLMLRMYSRGDHVQDLAQHFAPMLDAWEESERLGATVWTEKQQYTRHAWAVNLDHYIVCFWLVGLALALEIPDDQWQRLIALIGNEGEDVLLDRVIASRQSERKIGTKLCHPKPYLAEPKYRIRLADLVGGEVDRVLDATSTPAFALQGGPAPDTNTFTARVRSYEAACETLVAMAAVGGYWVEDWHYATWQTALTRLATRRGESGFNLWVESQRYPATLLLYALGLGAVEAGERGLQFIGKLFGTTVHREHREDQTAVELLPPFCLFERGNEPAKLLEGMDRRYAPLNDWLHALLLPRFRSLVPSESRFSYCFDRLEVLMALSFAHHAKRADGWPYWVPPGCYGYRRDSLDRIVKEMQSSIESLGDKSPYVRSGIFGQSAEKCIAGINAFTAWVRELRWF